MKKLISIIATIILSLSILKASDVYINPGHGDWSATDRPLATVRHAVYDTLGFFESNTNLWKALYLREQLEAAGLSVTMSRTDNGVGRNKDLDVIAAEADACGATYFISIHSNANTEPGLTNWPSFFYHSGEGGVRGQSDVMSREANLTWLEIWTTDVNATDKLEYCTYPSYITGDLRPDDGYYGVLWTNVPGYMAEAYFHTYRPSRHRCLNPDRCCVEGYLYAKAIKNWFHKPASTTGMIYGIVCDAQNESTQDMYLPTQPGWQSKTPLEGVKVQLRTTTGELITDIDCYPYVARHLTNQAYYTTDQNYNGVFVFKDIAPGNYKMDFLKYGYCDTTINISVSANQVACRVVPMRPGLSSGVFPGAMPGEMSYELNGGQLSEPLPTIITSDIVLPTPTKAGQYFLGWYWSANFSGDKVNMLVPGSEGTLYARWGDYPLARNAFASALELQSFTQGKATISYMLNDDATGLEFLLLRDTAVAASIALSDPSLYTKGTHTAEIELGAAAEGTYTWALRALGGSLPEPLKASERTPELNFYWSEGMAINNHPESPYFGQIYVTESWNGKMTNDGKRSQQGLYIFQPDLTPVGSAIAGTCNGAAIPWIADEGADGNGFFKAIHGPMRVTIDDDDYIYINDDGRWGSQQSSALYRVNPADPQADWISMFDLNYREGNSAGNSKVYTRINCAAFEGSGEEKKMYIVDWSDDIVLFNAGTQTNVHSGRTIWRNLPAGEFSQIPNRTLIWEPLHGGFWMFNFNGGNHAKPSVCHFDANKTCDLKLFGGTDGISDNANGGGALSVDGTKLAFCDGSALRVYAIAYNGSAPTLTLLYSIPGISATSSLAFDVADNLYCTASSTQYLEVFALPRTNPSYTTKAIGSSITIGDSPATFISNSEAAASVKKVVIGTHIYIVRGDKWYNIQGLEVEKQ